MLSLLPLLASLAADTVPPPRAAAQDAVVAVHRQPAVPLVALRLALLVDDPPGYAGAGHFFQHLLSPALQEQVSRVGGRVQMQRTSDAIVYTVTGPASELAYLSRALRSALSPPEAGEGDVYVVFRELMEERLAEWEAAPSHVRSALRAQLFPADISAAGTEESAGRFHSDTLEGIWALLYRPDRVSVTAVGDVELAEVQRAFSDLPEAVRSRGVGAEVDSVATLPLAPAQATQAWLGRGYLATDLDPAVLSVTAHLLADQLRERLPTATVEAEHWWTHHGQALALVVAAPEPALAAAQRALGTAVTTLQERVSPALVRDAAQAIRRDMLFYSRTPERMAQIVGQFTDRGGEPEAAQRFYASLERVETEDVEATLLLLARRSPVRVEIPPQKLTPRR